MSYKRIAPIEKVINEALWGFSEYLYGQRRAGSTWQQIAERTGIHRSTARHYALLYERYGFAEEPAPRCNELRLKCVCGEEFTASRADARYCSPACRQSTYRKRLKQD
jgi:hypothetical protein